MANRFAFLFSVVASAGNVVPAGEFEVRSFSEADGPALNVAGPVDYADGHLYFPYVVPEEPDLVRIGRYDGTNVTLPFYEFLGDPMPLSTYATLHLDANEKSITVVTQDANRILVAEISPEGELIAYEPVRLDPETSTEIGIDITDAEIFYGAFARGPDGRVTTGGSLRTGRRTRRPFLASADMGGAFSLSGTFDGLAPGSIRAIAFAGDRPTFIADVVDATPTPDRQDRLAPIFTLANGEGPAVTSTTVRGGMPALAASAGKLFVCHITHCPECEPGKVSVVLQCFDDNLRHLWRRTVLKSTGLVFYDIDANDRGVVLSLFNSSAEESVVSIAYDESGKEIDRAIFREAMTGTGSYHFDACLTADQLQIVAERDRPGRTDNHRTRAELILLTWRAPFAR